ncbi:MAG: LssY C-terminal domain-containing protein [Marinibacterium sp.]
MDHRPAALLEGFFVTGIIVPGMLVVASGGILVQQGAIDHFDLAWFLAIGSFLGGEASYWAGVPARKGIERRWNPEQSPQLIRARKLFERRGGLALVIGRFFGPLAGFVTLAAALSGMDRRRFLKWNIASAIPYSLLVPLSGYLLGDVFTRLGPLATRVSLFAGGVLVALGVLWWLVMRIERMLPFVLSVLGSMARAVAENEDVRAWAARNPRLAGFIGHRFDNRQFSGLTATLLGGAILYVLAAWIESTTSFLSAEAIVQADSRLANLIHAFWTPWLIKTFADITALGEPRVVGLLMMAALIWLWARRRPDLMLGLMASVVGNIATVVFLKRLFNRPRPELAYFVETSASFPSGHAAISAALYGMLFYTMWKLMWLGPIKAALLAVTLAFLIGLSRLYLIEHYLSDVINGWLIGALWMLIGTAVAEWWRATGPRPVLPAPRDAVLPAAACVLLVGFAGWKVANYHKAHNVVAAKTSDETVSDIARLFTSGAAPNETEGVYRNPLEPINVIVLARDEAAVKTAMIKAGRTQAHSPSLRALTSAGIAALTDSEDATAPVTPYFWQTRPNDFAFQKPTPLKTLRERHHVRFWRSRFVTPADLPLFVAAASFDDGLDWQIRHHIDPNIDAERDLIVKDLTAAGVVAGTGMLAISKPRLGESVAGDLWFTDGKAAVIPLK